MNEGAGRHMLLVSPVGGPHSVRGVVGTAVMCNHRKTGVYNAQQRGLVYSRFFFKQNKASLIKKKDSQAAQSSQFHRLHFVVS